MSADTVDDLHQAEDRIGLLEQAIRKIVEESADETWLSGPLLRAIRDARAHVEAGYCRVTCGAEEWDERECSDDCGCPCHDDGYTPGERERLDDLDLCTNAQAELAILMEEG